MDYLVNLEFKAIAKSLAKLYICKPVWIMDYLMISEV